MKAKLVSRETTNRFQFKLEFKKKIYEIVIWLDAKGKFFDDEISLNSEELESEGAEGDIREKIIDYLDANWDKLVKQ